MTSTLTHELQSREKVLQRLVALAVNGLPQMFDEESQLFCHRLRRTEDGLLKEGISRRYTLITLIGLRRLEENGMASPIDTKPVFEGLLANLEWINGIGDLGLLLWLCAVTDPGRLPEVDKRFELKSVLARYQDARQARSMELAWFLTGLSYWGLAVRQDLPRLRDLSLETYHMLTKNQGAGGVFGHQARHGSVAGWTRGRVGSFADQVYPIYAMSAFHRAYHDDEPLQRALDCAHTLCDAQGSLGQWWWHYDSSSGKVVEGYPVFSVHQHAMAPMTLFALGEVIQHDFSPWIYKGLQWVNGQNELGFDMEAPSAHLIWRCIQRPGLRRFWYAAARRASNRESSSGLKVLFECRPYELGWLLYAFAGRKIAPNQELRDSLAVVSKN